MNGTGPFQVVEYEQDVEIVYEPYEGYWGDAPEIEELTIRSASEASTRVSQLLAGETDLIVNVPPQEVSRVRDEDTTEVTAVPSTRVVFNAMRYDVEPFSSVEFRQAMNYAIDLDSIIENILQGFADATGQPTLEGFVGYNEEIDPYPQDIESKPNSSSRTPVTPAPRSPSKRPWDGTSATWRSHRRSLARSTSSRTSPVRSSSATSPRSRAR